MHLRLCLVVCAALPLFAQETILLRPGTKTDASASPEQIEERGKDGVVDRSITHVSQPSIAVYLPTGRITGTAMVICPGGGYQHLAIDKEGHDIARWLNTIGIAGIVLKYRLPGSSGRGASSIQQVADTIHVALEDAEDAMRLVRSNAPKWHIRPHSIGMMGFSAGGHLAAMVGMLAPPEARPDFLVLGYPAIPAVLSVSASTPPAFLVAADDDTTVNAAENAGRFYAALRAAKVRSELHVYSSGGHGFGILKTGKTSEAWPNAFVSWLNTLQLN